MIRHSIKTLFQSPKPQFTSSPCRHLTTHSSLHQLINTYNLPSTSATLISNKLKLTNPDAHIEHPDIEKPIHHCFSVFKILQDYNFSGTQIAKLIQKRPKTLAIRSLEALQARLQFLEEKGFKRKDLAKFIVTNPLVFDRGLDTRLSPAWEFLRTCVGTDDKVMLALVRWPWLLTSDLNNTAQPNVVLLMDHGVSLDAISKLIVSHPRTILRRPERMLRVIMDLKESGRDPGSKMFLCALKVMVNISEVAWIGKVEALRSIGLTEDDVKFLVKNYPICLACSEKKLRAAFDFLVNIMKLDLRLIVEQPLILMYGLERRVRPRMNVVKVLKSKNLVNQKFDLNCAMTVSEKRFLEKYVLRYGEMVPDLMDVYRGSIPP